MPTIEGIEQLRRIQGATETTYGTAVVPATWTWPGKTINWMTDDQKRELIKPNLGYFGDTLLGKILKASGAIDFPATPHDPLTAAMVMYYFLGGVKTATVDTGTGTGQVFKNALPTLARPAVRSMTLQVGNDYEVEQATGAYFAEYEVTGDEAGYVMHHVKLVSRAPTFLGNQLAAFNPNPAPTFTYNAILQGYDPSRVADCKFYLDPITAASYGTTQVSDAILKFKITYKLIFTPLFMNNATQVVTAAGVPGVTRFVATKMEVSGSLTFVSGTYGSGNTTPNPPTIAQTAIARNNIAQKLRVRTQGKALAVSGAYFSQGVDYDLPIAYSDSAKIGMKNGVDVFDYAFQSNIDPTNMVVPDAGFITAVVDGVHATPMVLPV